MEGVKMNIKPLQGVTDWPLWKRRFTIMLDYQPGASDAVDGKLVKPEPPGESATAKEKKDYEDKLTFCRKAECFARALISNSVSDEIYQKILDKNSAKEEWDALKQLFEASSKDQLFSVCDAFFALKWTSGHDVAFHVAKVKNLFDELNVGLKFKNENALSEIFLVGKLLNILPCEYDTFKSSWMMLTKNEERDFMEFVTQLNMFERSLKKSDVSEASQEALVVNRKRQKDFSKKRSCFYCKQEGHFLRKCRKWISDGRPKIENAKMDSPQSNVVQEGLMVTIYGEVCSADSSQDWWIDNGATQHVTNSSNFFSEYKELSRPLVLMTAGKQNLKALGSGTIKVISTVGEKILETTLNNVLYVPDISRNLFSVLATQDRNPCSVFKSTATECSLVVNGRVLVTGIRERNGSLFKASLKPTAPENSVTVNAVESDDGLLQLYHERWGHQNKAHIKKKLETEMGIKTKSDDLVCEPCIYGKMHRQSFGTRKKATVAGELVSTDVCGPFDASFQGKKYLVIFKDSFTKFRYGFVIKEKSEVKKVLCDVIASAKQNGHPIRELLSDNGGEFDNKDVREILQKNGIAQRLTAPYTPQQNGELERDNRTVVEMARTFMNVNSDANFPAAMWAELVTTAIYILNRTGKSSCDGMSPYQLWMGKKPRIKHLRIIGCECFFWIPDQKRRKMDAKAGKGYLVGYDNDERYRIYSSGKVILTRDVKFVEKLSECHKKTLVLPRFDVSDCQDEVLPEHPTGSEHNDGSDDNAGDESDDTLSNESLHGTTSDDTLIDYESARSEEDEPYLDRLRDREVLKKPSYLDDYVMALDSFVNTQVIPESYEEAVSSNDSGNWRKAMSSEMQSLKRNQTWELKHLPEGKKALPCKWVYKMKTNPDGSVERYKARLVVKGFNQKQGVDYNDTFSPVAKLGTVRALLSVAANENLHLKQFDVSTAFLYGDLDEDIYMKQPEGYNDGTDRVCKLKRSLYGLKQAPRCWNQRFGKFLENRGFQTSIADPCMYFRVRNGKKLILVLYVDDGLIAAKDPKDLDDFIGELKSEFKITSKDADYFLGVEIHRDANGICISQTGHAGRILQKYGFGECKHVSTPMVKTSSDTSASEVKADYPYRSAVGALMYLMLGTRPDLAYSVGVLSRCLEKPTQESILQLKRVFRYIAGTTGLGIRYGRGQRSDELSCFTDADYGGCVRTGRSTSGVLVVYAGGAISWSSQRQASVSTSTTEAELIAASEGAKEVTWMQKLFGEIAPLKTTPIVFVDNTAAIRISKNPEYHKRTKHIGIRHFFIREKITDGTLDVQQIATEDQQADLLTKPLEKTKLNLFVKRIGMVTFE
ncbi:secreted RxLR effector protein 161-like [Sergentomyia squamirostris]